MPIPNQDKIESEILKGLPHEKNDRLDAARENADYYAGRFDVDTQSMGIDARSIRTSLIMQRAVRMLTQNLYANAPARQLPDHEAAAAWLNAVYAANHVDAKWLAADRLAAVNQAAAFEVVGLTGPRSVEKPVGISLWGAEELAIWFDPDDRLEPIAVATLDCFDNRKRARLWTAEERVTFLTEQWRGPNAETAGGTAYREAERIANPYGVLPFAFVHFEFPTTDFWSGGPGDNLRELNERVNFRLSDTHDSILNTRPLGVIEGAPASWNFPAGRRPGQWTTIPGVFDEGQNGVNGRASYVAADLSFLQRDWDDLRAYLDHTLEMIGVPPSTIRMEPAGAASGISILVAEHLPLILWAKGRQPAFGCYEAALAKLVLTVGARHLRTNAQPRRSDTGVLLRPDAAELKAAASQLDAASRSPGLVLRWPSLHPDLPGPERDQADKWLLDNQLTSRTQVLMRRDGLTRPEAKAALKEVAKDLKREQKILSDSNAPTPHGSSPHASPTESPTSPAPEQSTPTREPLDGAPA